MKARPILMSAPMVRASWDGSKTQTRRALKSQPLDILPMDGKHAGREWIILESREPEPKGKVIRCRYGVPGDLLWVRESWRPIPDALSECIGPKDVRFAASVGETEWAISKWKPSIHMPRWASRLTLRITDVRVERLHDISEDDAIAEGVEVERCCGVPTDACGTHIGGCCGQPEAVDPVLAYAELWKAINGAESWAANPWCWALGFDVIKANVDQVMREAA